MLSEVFIKSDYHELYSNWDILEYEICFLFDAGFKNTFIPITEKNLGEYIKKEAELFLRLLEIKLPENFFSKRVCENCGNFDEPKHEKQSGKWLSVKWYRRLFKKILSFNRYAKNAVQMILSVCQLMKGCNYIWIRNYD